jgi:hypothetical protein
MNVCYIYIYVTRDIVRVNVSQRTNELWNTKIARSNYSFKQGEAPLIKKRTLRATCTTIFHLSRTDWRMRMRARFRARSHTYACVIAESLLTD